jgi:hypothetical protein
MSYNLPLTLAIVKTELGIADGTYDAAITAKIPQAEARFRQVAGYDFNHVFVPEYNTGSDEITIPAGPNSIINDINYGDIILSPNHPDGTYIIQNFKIPVTGTFGTYYTLKLSQNATATSTEAETVLCYNISHYPVLSQIVWYMIDEQDVDKVGEKGVASKRIGPVSTSYGPADINQTYGLPNKIVQQVPKYASMS